METILFENELIKIGGFKLHPNHPRFAKSGFVEKPLVVFPGNSIWIKHKNKDPFVADSSVINLYNRHQEYNRYAIDAKGDDCIWLEASESLLHEMTNDSKNKTFKTENLNCDTETFILFRQIISQIIKENYDKEPQLEELSLELFENIGKVLNGNKENKISPVHKKLVERIKNSVHNNLNQNQSLTQLAKEVYSSPYHICRVFKKITGSGINQYKNHLRLKKVYSEIQKENQDITSLAYKYGFSSHSHLTYNFRKLFGVAPSLILN